jgi:hypothetical protein
VNKPYLELRLYQDRIAYDDGSRLDIAVLRALSTVIEGEIKIALGLDELSRWLPNVRTFRDSFGSSQEADPVPRNREGSDLPGGIT